MTFLELSARALPCCQSHVLRSATRMDTVCYHCYFKNIVLILHKRSLRLCNTPALLRIKYDHLYSIANQTEIIRKITEENSETAAWSV